MREAIIMLELENLVEVKKGSGVYVINIPSQPNSRENVISDDAGPFEMLQARQLLESNIAEFAAMQVTPGDIVKMRAALELEREELASGTADCNGDEKFHMCIAEATQNSVLVDMLKQSWERRESSPMWNKLHSHIAGQDYREEWLDDHAKILAALQRKDPIAAKMPCGNTLKTLNSAFWSCLTSMTRILMVTYSVPTLLFCRALKTVNHIAGFGRL